ncbi:MAG: hypothetical protein L6R41_008160, partial [Letrouitia leprolyta]
MRSHHRSLAPPGAFSTMMLLLTLSLVPAPTLAATTPGSVSIWSDSSCGDDDTIAFSEPRAIELNQTLVPDT